jgi:peptide/nickel transport system substrate-binding protein
VGQILARALKILLVVAVAAALLWTAMRWARPSSDAPGGAAGGSLAASIRSEPASYNRLVEATAAGDLVSLLIDARLVRVNRETDEIEPALAESWTPSPDGLTYSLRLRQNVRFSDGTPFSSDDVVFSARAAYDADVKSNVGAATRVGGEPLRIEADGPHAVKVTLPKPFAPGLRLLDNLPILPKHRLESALDEKRLRDTWKAGTPPAEIAGLGPFVLAEHVPAQRLVFRRNPHYWKRDERGVQLPYLDSLTVLIIPDQNTEALRLEAGETDLLVNADIRSEDYATFKRAADAGRLRLIDVGIGLDPNLLWFNLSPALRDDAAWIREAAFRQAVSHAVDRQAVVDTVYLGAAVPIFGTVTPGNRTWYSASAPRQPYDQARARELLASIGLTDRNGDGTLDDRAGRPVRFSIVTQKGHTIRERTASVVQEHLRQAGITVDIAATDTKSLFQTWQTGKYDTILFGIQSSSPDPTLMGEFWLSSGAFHFWNPGQEKPATEWEARLDALMQRMESAPAPSERQQLFTEVQQIFGEQLPALYFAAPKVTTAVSRRVGNETPAPQIPQLLWNAERLVAR